MIYIVSEYNAHDALTAIPNLTWWAFMSDAKKEANRLANLNARPFYIYSFEQQDCIEPEESTKTFRLEFNRLKADQIDVKATDLSEAIKIARASFPNNEWDLIRSHLIEKE